MYKKIYLIQTISFFGTKQTDSMSISFQTFLWPIRILDRARRPVRPKQEPIKLPIWARFPRSGLICTPFYGLGS